MPSEQRQILTLRYMLGLSMPEIARATGKSTVAIRRAHSRAVAFLRERLTAVACRGAGPRQAKFTVQSSAVAGLYLTEGRDEWRKPKTRMGDR